VDCCCPDLASAAEQPLSATIGPGIFEIIQTRNLRRPQVKSQLEGKIRCVPYGTAQLMLDGALERLRSSSRALIKGLRSWAFAPWAKSWRNATRTMKSRWGQSPLKSKKKSLLCYWSFIQKGWFY
jgi:hypothetical protein